MNPFVFLSLRHYSEDAGVPPRLCPCDSWEANGTAAALVAFD